MRNTEYIILAAAPRKTAKKSVAVKQEVLFEKDLPPLTATVAQTFSGDVFLSMLGIAAVLTVAATYIVRKAEIKI